ELEALDPKKEHTLEIVIDRLLLSKDNFPRLKEAVFAALEISKNGSLSVLDENEKEYFFSEFGYCKTSKTSYPPLTPQDFSFNHPSGMCLRCQGLGEIYEFEKDKIIDFDISIKEGCCKIAGHYNTVRYKNIYDNLA